MPEANATTMSVKDLQAYLAQRAPESRRARVHAVRSGVVAPPKSGVPLDWPALASLMWRLIVARARRTGALRMRTGRTAAPATRTPTTRACQSTRPKTSQ
jgi:hypothetical protein